MMISPKDLDLVLPFFKIHQLKYTSFIDNIEDAVVTENERHSGTVFSTYTGFDYGRYHNLMEVNYLEIMTFFMFQVLF